eukprot:scaffold328449_cov26-Prasinocladus_malaysianus.AAC.1
MRMVWFTSTDAGDEAMQRADLEGPQPVAVRPVYGHQLGVDDQAPGPGLGGLQHQLANIRERGCSAKRSNKSHSSGDALTAQ